MGMSLKPKANVRRVPDEPEILTPNHGMVANHPKTLRSTKLLEQDWS